MAEGAERSFWVGFKASERTEQERQVSGGSRPQRRALGASPSGQALNALNKSCRVGERAAAGTVSKRGPSSEMR